MPVNLVIGPSSCLCLRVLSNLCVKFPLNASIRNLPLLPFFHFNYHLSTFNLSFFFTSLLPCFYASPMFGRPRKLDTEAELYDVAVRALMRRAHSIHEMKRKLERRSDNKLLVQVVMARLKENGQIDDARYAKQFARQRTESRKQGKFRIARDLRARGVPDRHIEPAPEAAPPHPDQVATDPHPL